MRNILAAYLFGFTIPYVYCVVSIKMIGSMSLESHQHLVFREFLYAICIITQIIFGLFEFIEFYYNKSFYFEDTYNLLDLSQPVFFIVHYILRWFNTNEMIFGSFKLIENLIELFILLSCLSKVFQYIRYKEQFTFFVQIFITVINELTEFMIAFLMFTSFFSVVSLIM